MTLHLNHSCEVIEKLLSYYPAVLADPICDGMLCLHFACKCHQSEAVIAKLFCAYPDAADKMDDAQKTPIHHMMENTNLWQYILREYSTIWNLFVFATIPTTVGWNASRSHAPTNTVCLVITCG